MDKDEISFNDNFFRLFKSFEKIRRKKFNRYDIYDDKKS